MTRLAKDQPLGVWNPFGDLLATQRRNLVVSPANHQGWDRDLLEPVTDVPVSQRTGRHKVIVTPHDVISTSDFLVYREHDLLELAARTLNLEWAGSAGVGRQYFEQGLSLG